MSNAHTHQAHALPLKLYLGIGAGLIAMTLVTVAVAQIHLGPFNLVAALGIATVKAILVGLYFMHLRYDNKLFAVIFLSALAFLGMFIIITLFDTLRRGDIYREVGHTIKPEAVIYENMPADGNHGNSHQEQRARGLSNHEGTKHKDKTNPIPSPSTQ